MVKTAEILRSRVLVVDDDSANVRLLVEILAQAGYFLVRGESDSRRVEQHCRSEQYDLILLDLKMPFMDGFDVLTRLEAIGGEAHPPVIILTADHDRDTRLRLLSEGACDFLTKPFDLHEVLCRIRNVLENHLLSKQLGRSNFELEKRVRERTAELVETRLQAIRSLGKAAEFRDKETGAHLDRMSRCSAYLAEQMGLSPRECDLVLCASPLHDIGKIAIPDNILLKSGPLLPMEWEVMKSHTLAGESILMENDSELFRTAATLARSHHEKWDGSGYPDGLKGGEIPTISRIVALCDVFDALLSHRPYKEAWTAGETVAHIKQLKGEHFEPDLVDLFERHQNPLLEIRSRYPDSPEPQFYLQRRAS